MKALQNAAISMIAVLASFMAMWAICSVLNVNASPAVLAAALSVGFMRHMGRIEWHALLLELLTLPLVALGAGLVGFTLLSQPVLGAVLFSGGITLSIFLRGYGEPGRAIGRVIALSLLAILVVPVHVEGIRNGWLAALLVILAGVVSLVVMALVTWSAVRLGAIAESAPVIKERAFQRRPGKAPIAQRMALQMLVALGLAFSIGGLAFPGHWAWVVLTAFIVCSGTVTRGDAIYRGLLRLMGAIGGAVLAAFAARIVFPDPAAYAATVFFVLFLGVWLRQINYTYWAACATLIFALLQESRGADIVSLLEIRIVCIVIGAFCGAGAMWFIYPVKTEQLVRKRIVEALGSLREHLGHKIDSPEYASSLAALDRHAMELEGIAPSVRLHRRVFGASHPDTHPATWLSLASELLIRAKASDFNRKHMGAEMRRLGEMLQAGKPARVSRRLSSDRPSPDADDAT